MITLQMRTKLGSAVQVPFFQFHQKGKKFKDCHSNVFLMFDPNSADCKHPKTAQDFLKATPTPKVYFFESQFFPFLNLISNAGTEVRFL